MNALLKVRLPFYWALIAVLFGSLGFLVACGGRTSDSRAPMPPAAVTYSVPAETPRGTKMQFKVTEVCIAGTVYLMTETGGISAKFLTEQSSPSFTRAYTYVCRTP